MIQAFGLTSDSRKDLPPAVDDVSFEAHAGRVTALLGAVGAGKTTTLRLMLELQRGRGIAYFNGRPLHRIPHPAREVGVLLGDVPGHPSRSVRGHLRMLCAAAGLPVRRADAILETVGLVSLREERLGALSRGMDRRLGLACALLSGPHTLVLDDPARGLSPREGRWLHGMLRAHAAQGGAVLFTTADAKEAARTADRVVTLESGSLVADQEAADFRRHRLRPRVAVRTPHAARLAALLKKEARTAQHSVEVVRENGNRLSVYGSTCAVVGEIAFRHGVLVHQLADEVGDMGAGAGTGAGTGAVVGAERSGVDTGRSGPAPAGEGASAGAAARDAANRTGPAASAPAPASASASASAQRETTSGRRLVTAHTPFDAQLLVGAAHSDAVRPAAPSDAVPPVAPSTGEAPAPSETAVVGTRTEDAAAEARRDDADVTTGSSAAPAVAASVTVPSEIAPDAARTDVARSATTAFDDRNAAPRARTTFVPLRPLDEAARKRIADASVGAPHRHSHAHSTSRRPTASDASAPAPAPQVPGRAASPAAPPSAQPSIPTPRPAETVALGASSPLPPPITVRPGVGPLRPLRYELRRACGIGTGFLTVVAVLVLSALTALIMGRIGHTPQPSVLSAWPRQFPLPPAALGAGLLGALAFGDEFRHPALAADRGTVPRRLGLLAAKLFVAAATALLLAFLAVGCDAEVLYVVYGRELTQVPGDWLSLGAGWAGLVVGCAWAGVLAAGLFRSTTAGLAAVLAVPVLVVPAVQKVLGGAVGDTAGLADRLRRSFLLQWPFGGDRYLAAASRLIAQPVGGAMALSLSALACAYLMTALRGRTR
ncbi:ABC transporter ATP-binding protein [Streptomyces sp. NPDC046985]|uniref:ABC transporter ATP-binding protein n=1 Tax=Streptomyces sp. NPDC046985 TaxID=3155377 RepID=UPI0033BFBCCF